MSNKRRGDCPACYRAECFAHMDGYCTCLDDNNFHGRPCPFFKTYRQYLDDQLAAEKNRKSMLLHEWHELVRQTKTEVAMQKEAYWLGKGLRAR